MAWYLFVAADAIIPAEYKGTSADPATFMTDKEIELSHEFSRIKQYLYFLSIPLEWMIYIFILIFGVSKWFRNLSEGVTRFSAIHTAIYVLLLMVTSFILTLPIDYYSYTVSQDFNISVQPFNSWMRDNVISFWINYAMTFLMVVTIYFLMRKKEKSWWFYTWLLSIPFTLFLFYIQPVWIDPLFNDFYRLQDEQLEEKILEIASKAEIPADRVYEVNMSEKTNALNAYVNGIGSNLRIVLWDTTLNKLDDDEVLVIMAHEMGHYTMNHLLLNLVGSIVLTFFGLWFGSLIFKRLCRRWGGNFGLKKPSDIASLPVLLLVFSLLSFIVSPAANAVSRYHEHAADRYAIELTKDPEAAVDSFQKLSAISLSEVDPPWLVKIFTYSHPTMLERIQFLEQWGLKHGFSREEIRGKE